MAQTKQQEPDPVVEEVQDEGQVEFGPPLPFKDFFKNAQFIQGAFDRRVITENEYRFNLARCGLFLWEDEAQIPEPPVVEDEESVE